MSKLSPCNFRQLWYNIHIRKATNFPFYGGIPLGQRRIAALALAALMALGLAGCGTDKEKKDDKDGAMSVQPAELTPEEAALVDLLDIGMNSHRIFDFRMGEESGVKSVMLRAYELENGDWHELSTQAQPFSDPSGRIALTFGKMPEGVKMAVQSESGIAIDSFAPVVEGDPSAMTYATSALTGPSAIEFDEEIPLTLQIATSKSEFSTYSVDYFGMPRELAKHDYDHVYAITVTFSQKPVTDIVQSIAPGIPESEPSAEPSPET